MGNVKVDIVAESSQAADNLAEIENHFYKQYDLTRTRYADGWAWRCKHCNSYAYSVETWFECQNAFVPEKIICSNWKCLKKTNAIWRFNLNVLKGDIH